MLPLLLAPLIPVEMEKVAAVAKNKLLLIPRDEESAMEMWTMLSAFPDTKVTMILPEDTDETSFDYDTSVTLTNAKVPCVFQGNVRMTKVRLLMNGAEAASFVQKTFEIKEQPQNTRTCVVRASINQYVTKGFAIIQKNPGGSCHAWLRAAAIDAKHLGDTQIDVCAQKPQAQTRRMTYPLPCQIRLSQKYYAAKY